MKKTHQDFLDNLWRYYQKNGRHTMPWRIDTQPYYIVVSEMMLQQTQVSRVEPKFEEFVRILPNWTILANAPTKEVLGLWQGLGYNRRALYLHTCANTIVHEHAGHIPKDRKTLEQLPGIGPNTSGAILVYSFNQPEVFIETNIRRVLIHHFFTDQNNVLDADILPILQSLMADIASTKFQPQTFYWALMDYGTYLKTQVANPNKRSKHYAVQSKFEGSNRQLRGSILRLLTTQTSASFAEISQLASSDSQLQNCSSILASLEKEGFIVNTSSGYSIP